MKENRKIIQNREGRRIAVLINEHPLGKGLAFVMHGLGGTKEQKQITAFAQVFWEKGFTVVCFDTTNTFGESDGKYEDATLTNYYRDLEDVIFWAKRELWFHEPFVLCGHSLGGISTALYAEKYPNQVLALAPISTVISGAMSLQTYKKNKPEEIKDWESSGWKIEKSASKPGIIKRLPWSHMLDRLKYDLLPGLYKLTMPVLLIVGSKDITTPLEDMKILFTALSCPKELHAIKDAPHTFDDPEHLSEIKGILANWINSFL